MDGMVIPWQPIVLIVALMVLDIISGFAGAAKSGVIEPGKMREGLWHKAGFTSLVILAIVWEAAALWINFDAAAIRPRQSSRGLDVDGSCGPITWWSLLEA